MDLPNRPSLEKILGDKYSDLSVLLQGTRPEGYDEYYNTRSPLIGKEISIGFIDKSDMLANSLMCWTILELFAEGQKDSAWDWMTWYQNDWKATMSIDGALLEKITSQEIKYNQTQTLHEYQHQQEKKGLFRR